MGRDDLEFNVELNCLYWPNVDKEIVYLHKKCFDHVGVRVEYTERKQNHSRWLQEMVDTKLASAEAVGFIDIDCLAYSKGAVDAAWTYAVSAKSFIGLAQVANYVKPSLGVYAAPAFLVVSRAGYERLGRPRFETRRRLDAGQDLSVTADAMGFPYRVLYPTGFNLIPPGGAWRLGNYGYFGIGTEYSGGFFHLFRARSSEGVDLFKRTASAILAGETQPAVSRYLSTSFEHPTVSTSEPSGNAARRLFRMTTRYL